LKWGLTWTGGVTAESEWLETSREHADPIPHALIIGVGIIGRQIASRLEIMGVDVALVDLSPINLHPFAQQGFHTVTGDARDPTVLRRARVADCRLAVVSVPDDLIAIQIASRLKETNALATIVVRCRYESNIGPLSKAGADFVISEEREACGAILRQCEQTVRRAGTFEGQRSPS
jgi:CPA2 family monovalent cation:H+ antiporter-2